MNFHESDPFIWVSLSKEEK